MNIQFCTRTFVLEFLKKLEGVIPPPENCHHAITFSRFGSDTAGWQEHLALQINKDGVFYCFFLDDDKDFTDHGIDVIVREVNNPTPGMQLGVAMGQYTK